MSIRVFIYDDSVVRRQSLRALIEMSEGLEYCGESADCSDVLSEMEGHKPDVVLMDIHMPGVGGIEGLKMLKRSHPEVRVLMQTVLSIKNGANGYVLKKDSPARLVEAIKDVYEGGAVMNPGIAQKVLTFFAPKQTSGLLSEREIEVLRLLADGYSYKMAAAQLGLSFHTINTHIKKIYEKLHVQSLGEAIAYYYKNIG
ncbi:MAG: response regulator transcription factor [Chitinophagaceae bacterium]|nr:response regulator transcription factor [Chitinophagaceae bacterium]